MKGVATKHGSRLIIRINQVETFDGNIPVSLSVVHSDYQEGLPLQEADPLAQQNKQKVEDIIDAASSSVSTTIPFTGIPLQLGTKIGNIQQQKIAISSSMTFKLRIVTQK